MSQFAEAFVTEFGDPQPKGSGTEWEILRYTMHRTVMATSGKNTPKIHDWFDAKSTEMRPVIEAKRTALVEYKQSPCIISELPEARFNKPRGDVQMSIGHSSARI